MDVSTITLSLANYYTLALVVLGAVASVFTVKLLWGLFGGKRG